LPESTAVRPNSFTYVTRLPPSPSGVALYASRFRIVLESIAPTRLVLLPPAPAHSQRLLVLLRTCACALKASRPDPGHVVVIELAGRGLAEFWAALLLSSGPWRRRIWVTLHDAPSVSGSPFLFTALDRRGGRRLARLLSDSFGVRAERLLLRRAERVFCLSARGVASVAQRLGPVPKLQRLPFVAMVSETPISGRRAILCPGYVDGIQNVAPVVRTLAELPDDWCLEVGACSPLTQGDVTSLARQLGIEERVRLLGYVDETALDEAFERAAVVIRWRHSGWRSATSAAAAVSGPLINAMAHGCTIITND